MLHFNLNAWEEAKCHDCSERGSPVYNDGARAELLSSGSRSDQEAIGPVKMETHATAEPFPKTEMTDEY